MSERSLSSDPRRDRGGMRTRIVDAAEQVIGEVGIPGATTRAIARAAGCAEGSIYVHFAHKEDLMVAVLSRQPAGAAAAIGGIVDRAGRGTVRGNVVEIAETVLAAMDRAVPLLLAVSADARRRARAAERVAADGAPARVYAAVAGYVRAEQRLGRVDPDASPDGAASALVGGCFHHTLMRHLAGAAIPVPTDELAAALVDTVARALRADDDGAP
jgi:AcrR family transcriptional regulator